MFRMKTVFIFHKVCTIYYEKNRLQNMEVQRIIICMKTLNQINSTLKKNAVSIGRCKYKHHIIYMLYYTTSCLQ